MRPGSEPGGRLATKATGSAASHVRAADRAAGARRAGTITAKLASTRLPGEFVPKPELFERLNVALERRLTSIVAGAGFGKSTALGAWVSGVRAAWYTADRNDSALSVLASGLAEALSPVAPEAAERLRTAVRGLTGSRTDERGRAEAVAAVLCEALDEETDDLILVIDDAHEIGNTTASSRLVRAVCRQAPASFHLVLSSRSEPPFPIARLRGRGEVLDIGPEAFLLSGDDIELMVRRVLGEGLDGLATRVHDLTNGWPAGVRLAVEALRECPPDQTETVLARLSGHGGALFSYLAEEVFAQETPELVEVLRTVAPFDRFSPGLCGALGAGKVEPSLARLERSGFLVRAPGSDEWLVLHRLVRDFVADRWPLSDTELQQIHRSAAEWFEARGHLAEAVDSLQRANDPAAITRFLSMHGAELLDVGAVDLVIDTIDLLPQESQEEEIILRLSGDAYQLRGDWQRALACFSAVMGTSRRLTAGLARRAGFVHYVRNDFEQALKTYGRATLDGSEPDEEAILLAESSLAHVRRGEEESARQFAERSLDTAYASGHPRALVAAHAAMAAVLAFAGERDAVEPHHQAALAAANRAGELFRTMRLRMNRSTYVAEEGRYREALTELDEAMTLADLLAFPDFRGLGFFNRGDALIWLGRLEEAIANYRQSQLIFEESGSGMVVMPLRGLARAYRERGDLALARSCYEQVLARAESGGDLMGLAESLGGLARILAIEGPEEAASFAERALGYARGLARIGALVDVGWCALANDDAERATFLANEAAEAARRRRDRAGLAHALTLAALADDVPQRRSLVLEQAIALWQELQNPLEAAKAELALVHIRGGGRSAGETRRLERRLQGFGVRVRAAAGAAGLLRHVGDREEPPVAIRSLGGFRVERNGEAVPVSAWQSKKARDLLKILVARHRRPVPREALMELLWREDDPGKLSNRLSVALSAVRSVLDPDRRYPPGHFIRAEEDAVSLDLEHVSLDAEAFLSSANDGLDLLRAGAEAIPLLEEAESSYNGEFLEEDLYEDWSASMREELRAVYVTVARALARTTTEAGEFEQAIRYHLRILERDPYDEDAHVELIAALTAGGRHGEARRHYATYVTRMEEIGVEPTSFGGTATALRAP
jgi:ATP/maltotriose-dependent transcriptional regulator MalT/DNA-binding SARP family transcriptional activator